MESKALSFFRSERYSQSVVPFKKPTAPYLTVQKYSFENLITYFIP